MKWEKRGFKDFSHGKLGNGGQNLYISAKGVLQRIFHYDINNDGYPDLLFANSQSMGERPPIYVYSSPLTSDEYFELPSGGSYDGIFTDLNGDEYDDLIVACQHDGTHSDINSFIYYGSEEGLSEKFKVELPTPDAIGVVAGDFNGDEKKDLAFICGSFLRVFYQSENGIVPFEYIDIVLSAVSVASDDIDGDGFCDLYMKLEDGSLCILWGSQNGLSLNNVTWIPGKGETGNAKFTTTLGRRPAYRGWRVNIITVNGKNYLFRVEGKNIFFDMVDGNRSIKTSFKLYYPGAVGVSAGDLDGDGFDDISVVVCTDKDLTEKSAIFWGGKTGFNEKRRTRFNTISAQSTEITDLQGDGKKQLIVCQGGTSISNFNESFILGVNTNRNPIRLATLKSNDTMRIVSGNTNKSNKKQIVIINHETGRVRGDEDIYIYLGGPNGYSSDRRIELPGWAAVDGIMYDYNDDGYVDVLVSNCSENAPHMDPGSFLYVGGPDGINKDRRIVIPSIRGHGAAIGDFRRCGYLDIAIGGTNNREIRVFKGGPGGYDVENPVKIVLGPDSEVYEPPVLKNEEEVFSLFSDENDELNKQFGSVRWLFTADFNADGWLDLFISEIQGTHCYILWGGPEGFSTSRITKLAADGVASANAADLDGDGYIDLVLAGHMSIGKKNSIYESYVTIYWGGPEGFKEYRKTQLPINCANSVAIGDFNGDGILDIYATAYNNGRSRDILSCLYYGEKGGIYSIRNRKLLFNHSGSGCIAGDFNGNEYTDLAVACHKGYGNHNSESFIFWGGPDGISNERKTILPTVGAHGMCMVDSGNIMDRSDNEYYYSESYRVPDGMTVKKVYWEATLSEKNWVQMQIRQADTKKELETSQWQGLGSKNVIEKGQDLTPLGFIGRYIQYKLILGAKCSCGTPRVTSVTVEFV